MASSRIITFLIILLVANVQELSCQEPKQEIRRKISEEGYFSVALDPGMEIISVLNPGHPDSQAVLALLLHGKQIAEIRLFPNGTGLAESNQGKEISWGHFQGRAFVDDRTSYGLGISKSYHLKYPPEISWPREIMISYGFVERKTSTQLDRTFETLRPFPEIHGPGLSGQTRKESAKNKIGK